jgi:hypothetical protein
MQSFLSLLLTLRIGLVPGPADGAVLSIREAALAAANDIAARDAFVTHAPAPILSSGMRILSAGKRHVADPRAQGPGWAPPPQTVLQREDWRDVIADALNGNQTIANAAIWLASAPVRLKVKHEEVFVAITLRTP